MRSRTLPLGIAIIAVGIIIVLGKLGVIQALISWLWPLLLLAAGVALHMGVWNRSLPPAALVPGAILAGSSIAFLLCSWFGWHWMKGLWPLFPLSAAVGLFEFSNAERVPGVRPAAVILGAVSLLLFLILMLIHVNVYVVALLLIIGGVIVIARRS